MDKSLLFLVMLMGRVLVMDAQVCFVAKEGEQILRRDGECAARFSPCSTFKVAISLMGYDAGILIDEKNPEWPFRHDYVDWFPSWKQAQNPTTWIKNSCVWYSQVITKKLGMQKFKEYVTKFKYGNQDVSGDKNKNNGLTNSWLVSSLTISADEQINFLEKLVRSKLPVSQKAHEMTRKILFIEDLADGWKLYGKTGSGPLINPDGSESDDKLLGWFIGWVQNGKRIIVFAYHEVYGIVSGINPGKQAQVGVKKQLEKLI